MKKLLVAVLALASVSAFANHKNLVSFDGDTLSHFAKYVTGSIDGKSGNADTDVTTFSFNVNYAWAVHSNVYVGGILGFSKNETETNGVKSNADEGNSFNYGLRAIYDLSTDHANSMYVSLSYLIENEKYVDLETTYTTVEFGKRYSMFSLLAGPNVTYAPSIAYTKIGHDSKETNIDGGSSITLNLVKFDVLF